MSRHQAWIDMAEDNAPNPFFCRRIHTSKDASEHLACPYCFGKKRETIEEAERKDFFDFDPDQDPITFGFPDSSSRNAGT